MSIKEYLNYLKQNKNIYIILLMVLVVINIFTPFIFKTQQKYDCNKDLISLLSKNTKDFYIVGSNDYKGVFTWRLQIKSIDGQFTYIIKEQTSICDALQIGWDKLDTYNAYVK